MKHSVVTGEYIYAQIMKLEKEVSRANEALSGLNNGTLAFQIVADVRDGKRAELRKLKRTEFIVKS